jgi:hypothetical protein
MSRLGYDNRSQWRAAHCPTIGAVADRRRFRIDVQMTRSRSDNVHRFFMALHPAGGPIVTFF